MASLVAQVAIALRELDIAAPSTLTDEATLRKIAALDRAGIMQSLKDAGISKLGHRMRLEQVLRESFAVAALDQIIPKAPAPRRQHHRRRHTNRPPLQLAMSISARPTTRSFQPT